MATFNLQAAINATLNKSLVYPKYMGHPPTGYCARKVRMFLERGGLNTSKRPGLARQYVNYLPKIGFTLIDTITTTNGMDWTRSKGMPGDIAVYKRPGDPSAAGHICMWNGTQWVSDFYQRCMNVYSGTITAYLFRWTGVIDYNITPPPVNETDSNVYSNSSNADTYTSNVNQSVFSDAVSNGMNITTLIQSQDNETQHTRIYSTGEPTITVSELSLPLDERIISEAALKENPTSATTDTNIKQA